MAEDEGELIKACQNKNPKAQEKLYYTYSRLVMGICLRYSKSRYDAEDILQEVFIKIFQNMLQYRNEGSFEGWIRRITVNTCLKKIQKDKVQFHEEIAENTQERFIDECVISKMAVTELVAIINLLPMGYKTVFNLFAVEGFSHKEIADLLQISEGTSKSQFFYAKKMLKLKLQENNIAAHAH